MLKNRILVVSILIMLLTSMLSLPLITSLSAAKGTGNGVQYQESVKGASGVAASEATPTQNGAKSLFDDWQNIFRNNSSSSSTPIWDFNNTNAWLSLAYLNGNKTRLVVGLSSNRIADLVKVIQIAARHEGKIVDTVSFKDVAGAAVVELPLTSVTSFVGEIGEAKLASYVEPNMKMQTQLVPNDPSWSLQWGPQKVQADWAWNTTTGNSSVLVAVVDTGIDYTHPELTANYVPLGFDWVNNDNDPIDDCGHGTHCAGIIAAAINNGIGIAGLAQVRIMAEKVLDYSGGGYEDWVANGIIHAVNQGAKIISMSLGGSGDSQLIHDAVKYAYSAGVLVIAAAGNANTNMKMYPAGYDEVVAVAATDQNDFKAGFSNWGDWIELAAPGVDIYSTMPTYQVYLNNLGYSMNYDYLSGTSMACPHVAGVAALLWSRYPAKSSAWIRQWLRYTADDLGDPGFDPYYGYGRINARNAVEEAPPAHELIMSSWVTPPYVEPGATGLVNATVLNFGESDETDVTVELLANDSVVSDTLIDFVPSGGLATASLTWNPTVEGSYNVTAYVIPVVGETSIANNALSKIIFVGTPVKAVVLRSYGNIDSNSITSWQALNNQWQLFGDRMVYVDYETLNKGNITYADIAATGADVLIISCAAGPEFADSEINAITTYVHEGHGLIATAGTFYYGVPNNNKLMPLFGLNENVSYYETGTDLLHLLNSTHPLFSDVPNPLVFPYVGSAVPASGVWDSNELAGGTYLAMGHFNESAIVTYKGLVYISPWLETIPPYYHHPLKLLYNAILWSRYQKPQHELEVSLEAPSYLRPGDSALLNATVFNMGLNSETNVGLNILIDNSAVSSIVIPELPVDSSFTIQFLWSPTIEKVYNVTAYAPPVPGEDSTSNNMMSFLISVRYLQVALFKNVDPWNYPADEEALSLYGIAYAVFSSSDFGLVNLSSFSKVVIASDQDQAFYNAMDTYRWWFEDYVSRGGVLEIHAADEGWNGGQWVGTLPGGLGWTLYTSDYVTIVEPTHPVVTTPNPITDAELDGWSFSVHGYFSNYPANSEIVITEDSTGHPAYLKFDYGVGFIVASSQTLEWAYMHRYSLILENSLLYSPIRYPHELAVTLKTPTFLMPAESTLLNATVTNQGLNDETNVELQLILNGTLVTSDLLPNLPSGSSYTLNYLWTTTIEGTYNVTAYAPPVENETMLTNNVATKFVTVAEPLIHPVEGQYAHYTITEEDSATGSRYEMGWNLTYAKYISPSEMNITIRQYQENPNYSSTGWMIVNIFNRLVEDDSGIGWKGMWYPGWIETEVHVGSAVNLLDYNSTVTGSGPILVGNHLIDCWEILLNSSGFTYEFWYDKASGLWIAMDASYATQTIHLILQDTNVPIGTPYEHELAVTLDAPSLVELGESATLGATVYNVGLNDETNVGISIFINDTTVDYATISTLHANENYTLSYLWTPTTVGSFNVTAYAPPVPNETNVENNVATEMVATLAPPKVCYTVEPVAIAPLIDVNASVYGLETPPSPSPVGQNFTVEIHLRNATSDNVPNGVQGVEVHFDFSNILNYCTPVGFSNMLGQAGGVLTGPTILYGINPGFYEDSTVDFPVNGPPYTNARFFNVAAASPSGPWNDADGVVVIITFQITSQPPQGQPDFYAPLHIMYSPAYLVDSYGDVVPFVDILGTLQIEAARLPSAVTAEVQVAPLNLKSHGRWAAGYIGLPGGFNVSDIDTSSLLLNGTVMVDPSAPVLTGDFDNDSALEVMVEFNRTQLANLIVSEGITFDNVTLMLTGQLLNGTQLAGTCQTNVSSLAGDVNCDGKVGLPDLILLAKDYGSHPGDPNWNDNADFAAPWEVIGLTDLVTLAAHYGQHNP